MGIFYEMIQNGTACQRLEDELNAMQNHANCFWIQLADGEILMIDKPVKKLWSANSFGTESVVKTP